MAASGIAWGAYSLKGRGLPDPLKATADNFTRSVAFVIPLLGVVLMAQLPVHASANGVMLAIASGAVTSGLGYALWYRVLKRIGATQGAIVQLTVPVIAAIGGTLFLAEGWTLRLVAFVAADPGRCGAGDHRQAKAALKSDPFPALAQLVGQRQRDAVLKGFAVGIDAR
jgi:drug/metabolite transporter (DMT)-like permease